jgi:hypothetical protein
MALERINTFEESLKKEHRNVREEWIPTAEAAKISGINRSTLNRYALTDQVEAKRVGGRWLFPRSRVEDLSFVKSDRQGL